MTDSLLSMADMMALFDLDAFPVMPQSRVVFARLKELRKLAANEDNEALINGMRRTESEELVRVFAARLIVPSKVTVEQIKKLGEYFLKDRSLSLRLALAHTLGQISKPESIDYLIKGLINSQNPHLRSVTAYVIRSFDSVSWQNKVALLLDELQADGRYREHLEMGDLITSIMPLDEELRVDRYLLTDTLITCVPGNNERMIGILAGLILESCGQNIVRAGERVDFYTQSLSESNQDWETLQAEINGLLTPAKIQANLERTFQLPLEQVTKQIETSWQKTIRDTQRELRSRIIISGIVSVGGIIMLGLAMSQILKLNWEAGLTSAILALLVLALSFFYGGSVKETRRTLTDIGVSNAVYAAYRQRMLTISHIYIQHYLTGNPPSISEVRETNKMIKEVVDDTVKALREERPSSLDDLIDQYS